MKDRSKIEQPVAVEFKRFNDEFAASLRSETNRLQSAIDQILNASGKHVRPLLVLLTAKACGQVLVAGNFERLVYLFRKQDRKSTRLNSSHIL